MPGFFISALVYFFGLWLGLYLLKRHDIEMPRFSKWLVINTFALLLSYVAALPF